MKKIFLLLVLPFIFACEPEEVAPSPTTAGSMTCSLNGAGWSAANFNNTLLHVTDAEPYGKRLDIRGRSSVIGGSIQIILSCGVTSSSSGNAMPLATYSGSSTYEGLVTVIDGVSNIAMATGAVGDPAAITITSIDGTTKTCSGTFTFKARNLSTDEIVYEAVSGVFTDIIYVVQ